jgi:hypothetical protein
MFISHLLSTATAGDSATGIDAPHCWENDFHFQRQLLLEAR